ncbi:MAG: TIGR01841 family phasin [Hyphomonadaceae bacterium]|nr:TIGR01841 family phasin [Hyphomonadaceae bacterium]
MAGKAAPKTIDVVEDAQHAFQQHAAAGAQAVRENFDRSIAAVTEMTSFGRENMEAWMASAAVAQKGMEQLSARAVAFSKSAMENHMAATKSLMAVKSVQELVEKQSVYAKGAFDAYVAELNSMAELMAGLSKDAIKPLNERMTAAGKFIQTAAPR